MAYATTADLEAWLGTPPPVDGARQLDRASMLLDANLMAYTYAVDANGAPTDATVITAFKNAVCAQVEWWLSNNDELNELGLYTNVSFEGASLSRAGPLGLALPLSPLAPRASQILRIVAGIHRSVVV